MNLVESIYLRGNAYSDDPRLADALVAYDFGDGGRGTDGELRPGNANYAFAEYVKANGTAARFDQRQGKVVYEPTKPICAQTLVAQALLEICPGIDQSPLFTVVGRPAEDNQYVDSWMVTNQAREAIRWARPGSKELTEQQALRQKQGEVIGWVAIVGADQHADRLVYQGQRSFCNSAKVFRPAGLPKVYADPDSTQTWTRSPAKWWPREVLTRALCRINGGEPSIENTLAVPGLVVRGLLRKIGLGQ